MIEVMEEVELIELLLVQVLDIAIDLLCLDVDFIFFNEYLVILLFAVFLQLLLVSFSGAMPTIGCYQAHDIRVDLWSIRACTTKDLVDALKAINPGLLVVLHLCKLSAQVLRSPDAL